MPEVVASDYEIERNKPVPSLNHSIVQANLELSLDLSIFPRKPLNIKEDIIAVTEPPLCVVEIISPLQSLNELITKAGEYFKHGVETCWIVLLPLGNICVFTSPDDDQIYRSTESLHDPVLNISISLEPVFS